MPTCVAILVAAGRGTRFGADGPKQYSQIGGRPLVRAAIEALLAEPRISTVMPVIHAEDVAAFAQASTGLPIMPPVWGGATRQASVRNGLNALRDAAPDFVLVHDAARPLVPRDMISRVIDAIKPLTGVVPVLPVADTLKRIDSVGAVRETVPREGLIRVQTPQGFRYQELLAAHAQATHLSLTDDAAVFEHAGHRIVTVAGSLDAEKVTTPDDLARMATMHLETRTGQGFDAHRLITGPGLVLCGVPIAHSHRLLGHSDADVAWHAATDAILGAIGAGDIGQHFPPSDPAYKNVSSDRFLRHAIDLLARRGGVLVNLDITIICERPKIAPHRDAMVARTTEVCGVSAARISVKATTTEAMGFTGRGEGIAAQAVATVTLPRTA